MTNVKQIIDEHNKTKLSSSNITTEKDLCDCRKKGECPMHNRCLAESIVYQATVTTSNDEAKQTYIGLIETTFKTRYNNHKASFTNPTKRNATELSKHIWDLKTRTWDLTSSGKYLSELNHIIAPQTDVIFAYGRKFIICQPSISTLNKRNELVYLHVGTRRNFF